MSLLSKCLYLDVSFRISSNAANPKMRPLLNMELICDNGLSQSYGQ